MRYDALLKYRCAILHVYSKPSRASLLLLSCKRNALCCALPCALIHATLLNICHRVRTFQSAHCTPLTSTHQAHAQARLPLAVVKALTRNYMPAGNVRGQPILESQVQMQHIQLSVDASAVVLMRKRSASSVFCGNRVHVFDAGSRTNLPHSLRDSSCRILSCRDSSWVIRCCSNSTVRTSSS